ncbi:NAD(P)H-binding protein [Bradyrhizobium sp. BWA-3-5]|uniref:NAD(P)H-binding protein n=1 Tax=Bradyrhizobium sp. BWA-3-5 TaxID=3080013 RepID=UPI00397BF56E
MTSAAGGAQGRTGRHVSEILLKRGVPVRAFVRQIDERSDRLKSLGAEIFVGDFSTFARSNRPRRMSRRFILPIRCRTGWGMRRPRWRLRRAGMQFRVWSTS